jgi:hypothetical protein
MPTGWLWMDTPMITTRQSWLGSDSRSVRLTGCLLGLVACVVFLPAVGCGFVDRDDATYVVENPPVMSGLSATAIRDAPKHAAPKRLSLHAAPARDTAALNADGARRLPAALAEAILPNGRPGVIIFLKADCECSKGFAVTATALAPHLREFATCTAVIEGTVADADAFAEATGLAIPFIAQPESDLAREWGVTKAGCFVLVEPDGSVEAVWPGISRQGFRDLAGRIRVEPPLPEALLAEIPGAAMAGCPLEYVAVGPAAVPMPNPRPNRSPETTQ